MPNLVVESPALLRKWTAGQLEIITKYEGRVTGQLGPLRVTNGTTEDMRDAEIRALQKELFGN